MSLRAPWTLATDGLARRPEIHMALDVAVQRE